MNVAQSGEYITVCREIHTMWWT